jgi:hypothetical protein
VASGCIWCPQKSFHVFVRNYFTKATLWMVLAALGLSGTFLDKIAAETVQQVPIRRRATAILFCDFSSVCAFLISPEKSRRIKD